MTDDLSEKKDPLAGSKYMGGCPSMAPLHAWPGMTVTNLVDKVYARGAYESRNLAKAAHLLREVKEQGKYLWVGISGAATPAGLGGLVAQLIDIGVVDGVISTGANAYHDLHYVFGLPVRQGSADVNDMDVLADGTTRIHNVSIRARETLKAQDMIIQKYAREVFKELKQPFSTATFLRRFGQEILNDKFGMVKSREGSMVLSAAKHDVPYFLDSGANHSLGMDLAALYAESIAVDTSPSLDVIEASAFSKYCQPQYNLFIGEGGPRNFGQTTAPTAAEIFFLNFEGSEGGVILSMSDVRMGALSGSSVPEAVSWGKYKDATQSVTVWSEYTITFPIIAAYLVEAFGKNPLPHSRLSLKQDEFRAAFLEEAREHRGERDAEYAQLEKDLVGITAGEHERRRNQ